MKSLAEINNFSRHISPCMWSLVESRAPDDESMKYLPKLADAAGEEERMVDFTKPISVIVKESLIHDMECFALSEWYANEHKLFVIDAFSLQVYSISRQRVVVELSSSHRNAELRLVRKCVFMVYY